MAPKPLVVIVGPTACGKTALSVEVAKQCGGEIICADSRTIYKGMDIGTAKPSAKEQQGVTHWGLDLVEPGEYYSVSDFKNYAVQKISEIRGRGHVPFLVGGTGLYINSVIFDYKFGKPAEAKLRSKLQHMTLEQLHNHCLVNGIVLPENYKNKRYVIRSIEKNGEILQTQDQLIDNCVVVGISTVREELRNRIAKRAENIFDSNVIDEAKFLSDKYGWDSEAMKSNVYPLIHQYLDETMSLKDIKEKFIVLDWRLAKRQLTWLRRNKFIHWLSLIDTQNYILDQLAITEQS